MIEVAAPYKHAHVTYRGGGSGSFAHGTQGASVARGTLRRADGSNAELP